MPHKAGGALLSVVAACGLLIAQEWWETKSFADWSDQQVDWILGSSPWVRLSSAGRRLEIRPPTPLGIGNTQAWVPVDYRIRLLTARPVREALLHRAYSSPGVLLSVNDLSQFYAGRKRRPMEEFVASHSNSFLVKGDDEHIIVSVTLRVGSSASSEIDRQVWREEQLPDEFSQDALVAQLKESYLETESGKRQPIIDYQSPASDGLGAKLYFERRLPLGADFITPADREMRLEINLGKGKVRAKFDLRKMRYKGKVEM